MRLARPWIWIGYWSFLAPVPASPAGAQSKPPPETPDQVAARTGWWREAKFGMFLHWGVYAVPADATDLKGGRGIAEWYFSNKQKLVKDYEKFAGQFNPVKFDAAKWVKTAKDAGMKYIVITSKHHDGFCMFDSNLTDYDIVDATPFKRDPMKELARECEKQGIKLCFYHSIMDWHHPDYVPRRAWEKDVRPAAGADLNRYLDYMKGQLRELLTNYGPIGIIWFDGGWEHKADELHAREVVAMIRSIQPGIIINDRINLPEDYDTPEQRIPANALPAGRLWETCMTMNDTWGYAKDDQNWKSAEDLVRKLCDIAHKGGNFLLNVGPTAEGEFPEAINERLARIGAWMKVNGASIYDTTRSPFRRLTFEGRCTTKGDTLYLHVFHWPEREPHLGRVREGITSEAHSARENGPRPAGPRLTLIGLKTPIRAARALDGGEPLKVSTLADSSGAVAIDRPKRLDPIATVIELKLSGAPVVEEAPAIQRAGPDGVFVLKAADADIHGDTAQYEQGNGLDDIGYWTNAKDYVTWTYEVAKQGRYLVEVEYASQPGTEGSVFTVGVADAVAQGTIKATGSWTQFKPERLGELSLPAGKQTLAVKIKTMPHGAAMNLRQVRLTPMP